MKIKSKKIVFLNDVNSAKKFINENKNYLIIPLNTEVEWFLEKNNFFYKTPFDYFNSKELSLLNEDIYKYCSEICDYINRLIKEKILFYNKNQINPGSSLFYWLKLGINTYIYYNHCINEVLLKENPNEIIFFGEKDKNIDGNALVNYLSMPIWNIIKDCADQHKIKFKFVKVSNEKSNLKIKKINLISVLNRIKTKIYNTCLVKFQNIKPNKINLITYKTGFSIKLFSTQLIKKNLANVFEFKEPKERKVDSEIKSFVDFLLNDNQFKLLFTYKRYNYFNYISNLISYIILNYFSLVPLFISKIKPFRHAANKTVLLTPNVSYADEYLFISIAKMYGIKIITWQHGSYGMFQNHTLPVYIDIKYSDYWFAFGPGLKDRYKNELESYNTKFKAIGNSDLKSYSKDLRKKSKNILFPLRYFRESIISDSNMMYPLHYSWSEYKLIFKTFSRIEKFNFICNIFPASNFNNSNKFSDYINHLNISNVKTVINRKYIDLLEKTDLVIIEWPYTALIQAIAADKQIICLNKYWELNTQAEKSLRKRCYFANNNDELFELLKTFENGHLKKLRNNNFINNYGNYKQDTKSWKRAYDTIVNEILNDNES